MIQRKHDKCRFSFVARVFVLTIVFVSAAFAQPTNAAELQKVKVGGPLLRADFGAMPLPLAYDLGLYKEEGLDVELVDFQGGGELMTAFAAQEISIGEATAPTSARGTLVGVPITIVSQLKPKLDNWGLMVLPSSPIKSAADLKPGMKLGITRSGSMTHFVGLLLIGQAGLAREAITFVPLGDPAANLAALQSNQIDGILMYSPASIGLAMEGKATMAVPATTTLPNFSNYVMVANPVFIKEHPDVVRRVLRATHRAIAWMKANPSETIERMQKMYKINPKIAQALYESEIRDFRTDGQIDVEGLRVIIDESVKYGFFNARPPLEKVFDPRFTPINVK
jgi:NitT/TauT family transport system substrate-binding protein